MKHRRRLAALVVLVILSSTSAAAPKKNWTIFLHRAGAIRFGMSLAKVRQFLRDPMASSSDLQVGKGSSKAERSGAERAPAQLEDSLSPRIAFIILTPLLRTIFS